MVLGSIRCVSFYSWMKSHAFGGEKSESGPGSRGVGRGSLGPGVAAQPRGVAGASSLPFTTAPERDGGVGVELLPPGCPTAPGQTCRLPGASHSALISPLHPQLTPLLGSAWGGSARTWMCSELSCLRVARAPPALSRRGTCRPLSPDLGVLRFLLQTPSGSRPSSSARETVARAPHAVSGGRG